MRDMPNWNLEGIFNEYYLELCERAFTPERTTDQCDLCRRSSQLTHLRSG